MQNPSHKTLPMVAEGVLLLAYIWTFAGLMLLLPACMPAPETTIGFEPDETKVLVTIVYDTTGSFEHQLFGAGADPGKAWTLSLKILERVFREYGQEPGAARIVLARIYGDEKAILLDSQPQTFRQQCPDAAALQALLLRQPDSGGSRVYLSLRDTVDYLVLQHRSAPKLKSLLCVLSDMDDNVGDSAASKALLEDSLRGYAKAGGLVAIYGCALPTVPEWSRVLARAGFKEFVVEPDIRDNPRIPVLN